LATRLLSGTHARGLTNVAAFCRYARYFIPTFCNIVYIARLFRLTRAWLAQSSHRWLWWTTDCKSCCMRNEAVGSTGVLCKRILRVFSTRASRKSRILSSTGVLSTSKLVQWRNYVWNCAVVPESTGSCRRSAWWTSPPRSARTNRLLVPSVKLSAVGGRAFAVAGPTIWNSLPDNVISAPSLSTFRQRLKHFCSRPRSLTLSLIPGKLFPNSSGS